MTFKPYWIALALVASLGQTSQAQAATQSVSLPQGGTWTLFRSGKVGNHHTLLRRNTPTITFDGSRVTGTTGCNAFSSSARAGGPLSSVARVSGAPVTLGPVIVARAACTSPVEGNLEASFLKSLGKVTRYAQYQNLLVLYTSERESLIFRRN